MVRRSPWAALSADLRRDRAPRRPAAAPARPPHLLRPRRLDVLDRQRRDDPGDDGGFAEPPAIFATRARPHRCEFRAVRDRFAQCGHSGVSSSSRRTSRPSTESISSATMSAAPVTRFDALLRELSEPARSIMIDPRPAMREAAAAHDPILLYPKTETHWNELGAFYGYRAIMTALARSIPIDHPETLSLDRLRRESHIRYAGRRHGRPRAVLAVAVRRHLRDGAAEGAARRDRADRGRPRPHAVPQSERQGPPRRVRRFLRRTS